MRKTKFTRAMQIWGHQTLSRVLELFLATRSKHCYCDVIMKCLRMKVRVYFEHHALVIHFVHDNCTVVGLSIKRLWLYAHRINI